MKEYNLINCLDLFVLLMPIFDGKDVRSPVWHIILYTLSYTLVDDEWMTGFVCNSLCTNTDHFLCKREKKWMNEYEIVQNHWP